MKIEVDEQEVKAKGLVEAYLSGLKRLGLPKPENLNLYGPKEEAGKQGSQNPKWMPSPTLYQFIRSQGVSESRLNKHINHFSNLKSPTDNKFLKYAKDHLIEGARELTLSWKLSPTLMNELSSMGLPKERIEFYTSMFLLSKLERQQSDITPTTERECYKYILTCWNSEITSLDQISDPVPISKYWKPEHAVISICQAMGYSKQSILEKALQFKESREGVSKHWNRDFITYMGNRRSSTISHS